MRVPEVYSADYIKEQHPVQFERKGRWFLARPLGLRTFSLRVRLHIAWRVFKGEMDALIWMEPENNSNTTEEVGL